MSNSRYIIKSFNLFFTHNPKRIILLFFISLILGFNQGFTILLLIPLLGLINPVPLESSAQKWMNLLNEATQKLGIELSLEFVLSLFAISLISIAILRYYQVVLQNTYQNEFSFQTRKRLHNKILGSPWAFLSGNSKHGHMQVLTNEIPKMTNYYSYYLDLATKSLFVGAHIALALLISPAFTLFVVLSGMVIYFLLRGYLQKALFLGNATVQSFRDILKNIDDFWGTVKIAKVHNAEWFYFRKFNEVSRAMLSFQNKQARNNATPQFLFTLAGILTLIVVVYLAVKWFALSFPTLVVLILLFNRIFPQLTAIHADLIVVISHVGSVKMVLDMDKILAEKTFSMTPPQGEIAFREKIEIKDLTFAFDQKAPLFSHFSATIPAYSITGVLGKSGCGKTTLIDIIAQLYVTEGNTLFIDGVPLTEENLPLWRNQLGYMPQDPLFIDGTLRENLIWDSQKSLTNQEIMDLLAEVNASHLIDALPKGLDTPIVNITHHFSAGEIQRLALARVLIRKPKLLLLDEATSALDLQNERQIMELLVQLKKRVTIILVTHHLALRSYFDCTIDLNQQPQPDA